MSSKSDGLKNKIGWNLSRVIGGQSDGAEVYWRHLCGQHQTGPLPLPHPQDVADSTRKGYHHWIHQEWGFQVRHQFAFVYCGLRENQHIILQFVTSPDFRLLGCVRFPDTLWFRTPNGTHFFRKARPFSI